MTPRLKPLRDFQNAALEALRQNVQRGHRRQVLSAPTGSGKTEIALQMMANASSQGRESVFIVDRLSLLDQTHRRLSSARLPHDMICADASGQLNQKITLCSAQTLESRQIKPRADLLIVDEAHMQRTHITDLVRNFPGVVVGMTATPFAPGMADIYDGIVSTATTYELIEAGYLTNLHVYAGVEIDMTGVKPNSGGEWSGAQVERQARPLIGDIVGEWQSKVGAHFDDLAAVKTLLFSATIAQGEAFKQQFECAGFRFEQVRAGDSATRRTNLIQAFRAGKITGLISCDALAKGFDAPEVQCLISARPYNKSVTAHIQEIGRGMRPAPHIDKKFCVLLDHAGNWLGFHEPRETFFSKGCATLKDSPESLGQAKRINRDGAEKASLKCKSCDLIFTGQEQKCRGCGAPRPARKSQIAPQIAGVMRDLGLTRPDAHPPDDSDLWSQCSKIGVDRFPQDPKKAYNRAAGAYFQLTGQWPKPYGRHLTPANKMSRKVRDRVLAGFKDYHRRRQSTVAATTAYHQ